MGGVFRPEIVTTLEVLGPTEVHELRVRFVIEAPTLRAATDLAAALRQIGGAAVRVRPAALSMRRRRWTVTMTVAGPRSTARIIADLQRRVHGTVASREGCRLVTWHPVPDPAG
jgi:hypothetical protein